MNVHQTELICAILGELDRQHPGATLIQDQMNATLPPLIRSWPPCGMGVTPGSWPRWTLRSPPQPALGERRP